MISNVRDLQHAHYYNQNQTVSHAMTQNNLANGFSNSPPKDGFTKYKFSHDFHSNGYANLKSTVDSAEYIVQSVK